MGAGGSVDDVPRKLQNFIAMKAYNLRQASGMSIAQQFAPLKQTHPTTKDEVLDFDALCSYLQIPSARQASLRALFQLHDNHLPYADLLRLLEQPAATAPTRAPAPSSARPVPPPATTQLVRIEVARPSLAASGASSIALVPGLWKKREITIQERIVEYTKIDEHGVPQNLIEKEKHQHEIIHMESTTGEFAHREVTYFEQTEELNNEVVHHDTGKEEFVHLKSKDDEISHFESSMPQRPPEACEQPPPSPTLKKDPSGNNDEETQDPQQQQQMYEERSDA
ncbi:hypothetical protein SDRG_09141 [Saprolegnia diclina VS20]|uniref:Uncharacterized protein n=1 Tax=Saprolegnia diclina (strain VS20) TaxID=1156394 RepID=T0Q5L0_SAPDV|nr:hypothetical protein SDRG_09141 [Saprolegnia diclina VS20]EQC33154.1 hypothetical protein SDRG_09141 [Saprolegnia diclina VS20]|eukprot:XP_008613277.1 hypothetical protein SDRG_09141 [Saprolegnia diclina VS20]